MTFLQKIHDLTLERVEKARRTVTPEMLRDAPLFGREAYDVKEAFAANNDNIIAEIKFASPSEGVIHPLPPGPSRIAQSYLEAGAAMLSILTEPEYFKGELEYLEAVRRANPGALLLRKDFMVDPYQLLEAKAHGADAILIIVAMTPPEVTRNLFQTAKNMGLTPLVEVHDGDELDEALKLGADFIGVNNRNLKTLKIDLNTSRELAARRPEGAVFVCESGLSTPQDVREMQKLGYSGFLMGTHFMKQEDPGAELKKFREGLSCG